MLALLHREIGNMVTRVTWFSQIVDTETPFEIHDIVDGFLVGLEAQKSLRHSGAGLHFLDMTHLHKGSNLGLHDIRPMGSIIYVAIHNMGRVTSINVTFVSNDGVVYTIRIEKSPMPLDQINNAGGLAPGHMADLQMFSQVGTVAGLVKVDVEGRVDSSRKLGPYLLNEFDAFRLINKEIVIVLAVGESTVIQPDAKAIRKDRDVQRPRVKGGGNRFLELWVKTDLGAWSIIRRWASIHILSLLSFLVPWGPTWHVIRWLWACHGKANILRGKNTMHKMVPKYIMDYFNIMQCGHTLTSQGHRRG
jgi:hypothetical protein